MRNGELLKKLRTERGVSQRQLTEDICARSTLATFENEGSHLSVDLCSKFLNRLNIRIDSFLNLLSEDFDEKRVHFFTLKKMMDKEDTNQVTNLKNNFRDFYKATNDLYWLHLYILSEEFLFQIENNFTYESFKKNHKEHIIVIQNYLFKVENWSHFEFALFSNSIWYIDFDFVVLIRKRLKEQLLVNTQYKKEVYGKYLLNLGFYCLEYGHFDWLPEIKEEVFKLADHETIHWKIITSFQLSIAEELTSNPSKSKKDTLSFLSIYSQLDEKLYFDNLVHYRERLIKKHKEKSLIQDQ